MVTSVSHLPRARGVEICKDDREGGGKGRGEGRGGGRGGEGRVRVGLVVTGRHVKGQNRGFLVMTLA